jgi:hypothetical protein
MGLSLDMRLYTNEGIMYYVIPLCREGRGGCTRCKPLMVSGNRKLRKSDCLLQAAVDMIAIRIADIIIFIFFIMFLTLDYSIIHVLK